MEEYLYGLGGCVWRGGDNSGDEEDEEAMVMRVGRERAASSWSGLVRWVGRRRSSLYGHKHPSTRLGYSRSYHVLQYIKLKLTKSHPPRILSLLLLP